MSKSGDQKRAERLKAALRDNLKRRKVQLKARSQGANGRAKGHTLEHDSAGIPGEIAQAKPKG
jgi:predicted transcriptional regulator